MYQYQWLQRGIVAQYHPGPGATSDPGGYCYDAASSNSHKETLYIKNGHLNALIWVYNMQIGFNNGDVKLRKPVPELKTPDERHASYDYITRVVKTLPRKNHGLASITEIKTSHFPF
jgi:hypothetical protein